MAVTSTPVFVQTPKVTQITILPADTTAQKVVCTAGANGTKVVGLIASSNDTATMNVQILIKRSSTSILLGTGRIVTLSGTDGAVANVNLLNAITGLPVDNDGQPYIYLVSGDTLECAVLVTVTAAKTVSLTCIHGDF